jgi:hypothetical protein
MTEEAKKAGTASPWKTKQGAHLLEAMLYGKELTPDDKALLQALKKTSKLMPRPQTDGQPEEDSLMDDLEALTQQWLQERAHLSEDQVAREVVVHHKEQLARRQAYLDSGIHVSFKPAIPYWPHLPQAIQKRVQEIDPL